MKDVLRDIVEVEGVEAVYVFAPTADVVASAEGKPPPQAFSAQGLQGLVSRIFESREVSELFIAYPEWFVALRGMGERVLLVLGNRKANPALVRMAMEVSEHRWRGAGLERVFPKGRGPVRGDETKAEVLGELGKPSPGRGKRSLLDLFGKGRK